MKRKRTTVGHIARSFDVTIRVKSLTGKPPEVFVPYAGAGALTLICHLGRIGKTKIAPIGGRAKRAPVA